MIPKNHALMAVTAGQRAAVIAATEVDARLAAGQTVPEYARAKAFFRQLTGAKCPTLRDFRYFRPQLTERSLRGNKQAWLLAIDTLIRTGGLCCMAPLTPEDVQALFPMRDLTSAGHTSPASTLRERKRTRRQQCREAAAAQRAYQAIAGQAEIELAFCSPDTVIAWVARWRKTVLSREDMESQFFRWVTRFPILAAELDEYLDLPLWRILQVIQQRAKATPAPIRMLERWIVPNKLTDSRVTGSANHV